MKQYLEIMNRIIYFGSESDDRTGVGTLSIFGTQSRYDLQEGFPLVTSKFVPFRLIAEELLWFLSGSTNNNALKNKDIHIWDEWEHPTTGELGPVYGKMWRQWPRANGEVIDQISELIAGLRDKPFSRRHIVSGWNPDLLPDENKSHQENVEAGLQVLPPCHTMFQFHVRKLTRFDKARHALWLRNVGIEAPIPELGLSCQLYARSQDWPLGTPFNIASYALLTHMLASVLGYAPLEYVHTTGDTHIYKNQLDIAEEQLGRETHDLPMIWINPEVKDLFKFTIDDFKIIDYEHSGKLVYPIAV